MIIPKGTVVTIDGKVYRTLEAQVAWNKEELESLDIESLEALPDQFTELQENVSALGDSFADVTEDVGDLKSDMSDAQSDISGLKGRMTSAETNIGLNAGEISQLQFDVGQAQGDITALGNTKLNKPTNTGEVGDVIVKTEGGTEFQSVAPFNPNGTYPNVTAGKAISAKSLENVSEDSGATQTAPFFFQATATANNTEETPTAPVFELKSIRGNTIVYNQLVDGMTTTYPTISGHKYWAFHVGQPPVIVTSQGTPISFPSPQSDKLVDLTRWFNGSIPQAILDDPTIFPINYYDGELTYSAGELKNCSCTEQTTVGFNQFDKSNVVADSRWKANGAESSNGTTRSDYIRCVPNATYFFKNVHGQSAMSAVYWFDACKNYISSSNISGYSPASGTVTAPANARYFGVNIPNANVDDCCVNLSWDGERDGEYAPYVSHTYPMVWSGKSAGSAYDEKLPDGNEITRIGSSKAKSISWVYDTSLLSVPVFRGNLPTTAIENKATSFLSNNYAFIGNRAFLESNDKAMARLNTNTGARVILIRDDSFTDATAFKNHFTDDDVIYFELATPTTSEGTPYTSEIEGDDYGTMSFDSVVPVGNEFFYPADYSLLIDDLGNYTGYDVTKLAKKTDLITAPTGDGTYTLKATVSGDTVTYTWEAVS